MKHHYLPVFYLRQWAEADGKVPTLHRLKDGRIVEGRNAPKNTGFEDGLYELEHHDGTNKDVLETDEFARNIDEPAAPVLEKLLAGRVNSLTADERDAWSRFALSLHSRGPTIIGQIRDNAAEHFVQVLDKDPEEYESMRGPGDPEKPSDVVRKYFPGKIENAGLLALTGAIDAPRYRPKFLRMTWWTESFERSTVPLVLSDRPFVMLNGLDDPRCILAVPLSPSMAFFASSLPDARIQLRSDGVSQLARRLNEDVVANASQRVYGQAQIKFVERHMGTNPPPQILSSPAPA